MRRSQTLALIFIAALLACVAATLWPEAFPTAAIDFRVTAADAPARLADLAGYLGRSPQGYYTATSFGEDSDSKNYIELEYSLRKLEEVTRSGLNVWYWTSRWFKPEQHEEFSGSLDPQGRIVGCSHTIEEERSLPSLDKETARNLAESFITRFTQHPLQKLRFISDSTDQKPHRTNYTFTWERDDFRLGAAPYRVVATVQGNEIGGYNEYLKIPDNWSREFARKREVNALCESIALCALAVIIAGLIVLLIIAIKEHRIRVRGALPWGWFAVFAVVGLLAAANSIPEFLNSYATTENWGSFIARSLFSSLRSTLFELGALWLLAIVADAVYREKLPGHLSFRRALGPEGLRDPRTARSIFIGLVAAIASVAYVSAYYAAGKRFGFWAPVEIEYAKTLSGWFPWISPIQTGLTAAFGEEMLFRVVALLLLWKVLRIRWLAVLLSSATWAFLHSNYPQMPGYVRGIELTIEGIGWSLLLLRYGLLTTLTAHYLYDCWLGNMIVFQSASWADRAGALLGSGWPIVFLFVSWRLSRARGHEPLPAETEEPPSVVITGPEQRWSLGAVEFSRRQRGILLATALIIFAACITIHTPQRSVYSLGKLDLDRDQIALDADRVMRDHGFDPGGYHRIITASEGSTQTNYLLENGPYERLAKLFRSELPDVYWQVRYFKFLQREEFYLQVDKTGRLLDWRHSISREAPGKTLSRAEALALAAKTLGRIYGEDPAGDKLLVENAIQEEHRRDYSFDFSRTGWQWGEAELRTRIHIQGDEPSGFTRYIKVPEAWLLQQQKSGLRKFLTGELNIWIAIGETILAMALLALLIRRHLVPWRTGFLIALLPASLAVVLYLNQLPWFYSTYATTMSLENYLARQLPGAVLAILFTYLADVFLISLALGFVRWAFGWKLSDLVLWPRSAQARSNFWMTTLVIVAVALSLEQAQAKFGALLAGFFAPTQAAFFEFPAVNASVPWLSDLVRAFNGGLHHIFLLATVWSAAALLYRRFPRATVAAIAAYPLLMAIQRDTIGGFLCAAVTGELSLFLAFFLISRVFRFNAAALFLESFFQTLIPASLGYLRKGGPSYSRQALPLFIAMALPLAIGWAIHRVQRRRECRQPECVAAS